MSDHPLAPVLWIGLSMLLAKFGPVFALLLRH